MNSQYDFNLLEEKVTRTLEGHFSCEIAGPSAWEFVEPVFDYFKSRGYNVRTHSTKVDGVIQNA